MVFHGWWNAHGGLSFIYSLLFDAPKMRINEQKPNWSAWIFEIDLKSPPYKIIKTGIETKGELVTSNTFISSFSYHFIAIFGLVFFFLKIAGRHTTNRAHCAIVNLAFCSIQFERFVSFVTVSIRCSVSHAINIFIYCVLVFYPVVLVYVYMWFHLDTFQSLVIYSWILMSLVVHDKGCLSM